MDHLRALYKSPHHLIFILHFVGKSHNTFNPIPLKHQLLLTTELLASQNELFNANLSGHWDHVKSIGN